MRLVLCAIVMSVTLTTGAAWSMGDHPGIVTFTVDNITKDFFEKRLPAFVDRNMTGTLYAQTRPIGKHNWNMSWDNIRILHHIYGWEIGAHSYSHEVHLTQADDDTMELELGAPAAEIYRQVGTYPVTFATPFGDYDDRVVGWAKVYYDAHLGAWGNHGFNDPENLDVYRLVREEITHAHKVPEVCDAMRRAGETGQWLVHMLHGITDEAEATEYTITHDTLLGVLDCAADLVADGKIEVLTVKEALASIRDRTIN